MQLARPQEDQPSGQYALLSSLSDTAAVASSDNGSVETHGLVEYALIRGSGRDQNSEACLWTGANPKKGANARRQPVYHSHHG